jgi:aryl-alcohol dehydrogenase-like predicted oxidoreductase
MLTGKYNAGRTNKIQQAKDTHSSNVEKANSNSRLVIVRQTGMSEMADIMLKEHNLLMAEEVVIIAKEIGRSPAQVALNWVRQQNISNKLSSKIIPIIGARNTRHLEDNLAYLEFELSEEHMKRLDEVINHSAVTLY